MKMAFLFLFSFSVFAQIDAPEWPVELIDIKKIEYPRNHQASFCQRPTEMVDTVVIHHTNTPSTSTPMAINEMHLNRGTPDDPWYMIAYSYVVNSPYAGDSRPVPEVTFGRPLELVGAHAGTDVFVSMDEEQLKIWNDGRIVCGKEGGPFVVDPKQMKGDKIKANVTTIGLVVIGNYAPFGRDNPGGYSPRNPRNPTLASQDIIARTSCQLQKKYPRMRNIRWHNFYHSTDCPGTIKQYISQIRAKAKEYGCEFN